MEKQSLEHLIVRYLSNEASSTEQLQLFELLAQSDEHQKIFHQYCDQWRTVVKPSSKVDVQQAFIKLNKRVDDYEKKVSVKKRVFYFAIAASISLFIATTLFLYSLVKNNNKATALVYIERSNAAGKRSTILLADGSSVILNANSKLRFPEKFNAHQREVYLEGEAFFNVQKDSLKPFIVHTQQVRTRVLGTSFNVNESDNVVEVSVASGKVKVMEGNDVALLLPNDKVTYDRKKKQWHKQRTDLESELGWKSNTLVFKDKPMGAVVATMQDWYGVTFKILNKELLSCRVTGKFKNESLQNVLTAIAYSLDLEFQINKKEVTLSGKGCEY